MSRNAPIYDSGTIPAGGGSQQAFINKIVEKLTEYQSNGEDAWELADEIDTGANFEKVYHSVGDRNLGSGANKGDTDIWVYLHKRSNDDYEIYAAQDYSPTSGTALNKAFDTDFANSIADTTAIDWWSVCNEYEFFFVWIQGGNWGHVTFGQVIRPYRDVMNGVARISNQSGTGDGVTFDTDRDISSNIAVGQYIWLVNQTPDGVALQSVGIDLCEVTAVDGSSITVDGVVNTYADGSLVGLDPAPVYCFSGNPEGVWQMVQRYNGTYSGATANDAELKNPGSYVLVEASMDPGPDQLYHGFQPALAMSSTSGPGAMRGKLQHFRMFPLGVQTDLDIMEVDWDSNDRWRVLVAHSFSSTWCTAFGPIS